MPTARRSLGFALTLACLTLGVAPMTGCESSPDGEPEVTMEELIAEARDLRARNAQVESALDESERIRQQLESERDSLAAENNRLKNQANARPDLGFDGIAGAQVSLRNGQIVVDVAGDVLFDSGKATLKSSAKTTLDQIAREIQSRYGGNEIRIAGHTDSDPIRKSSWKTNERLGAERALAVEEYLATRGISNDRMHIASYGPSVPKGSKQASRRVEIVIMASGG
ncbi:MAG: OmpA family protein [Phycisphaerales bacterium]